MQTIGVFFGGRSPEHDISVLTAQLIIAGLKKLGHAVVPVYLNKEGSWLIGEELGTIAFFQHPNHLTKSLQRWQIDLAQSFNKLTFRTSGWRSKSLTIDLAFPAFHGQNGEDGTIQGLFEIFNVPYVGCDVTSSALTMDKVLTKQLYQALRLPTTKFLAVQKSVWQQDRVGTTEHITKTLRLPLFVKPARLGSSIAVAKVTDRKQLEEALDVAVYYDEKVIVEEAVENVVDITCAVLGNDDPQPSLLQESVFQDKFFSYEDKYLVDGGTQLGKAQNNLVIPANLDPETTKAIQQTAVRVFQQFGCSGIARVDFLYDRTIKTAFVNEVNTLPGTLYHHLWEKSGIPLSELLTRLLTLAKERHTRRQDLTHTFNSPILQQINWSSKLQNSSTINDKE